MSFDIAVALHRGDREIACRIAAGEGLTILFGPSGAGKTSILHMVAGLLRPDRGHIRVGDSLLFDAEGGIDVPVEARRCGVVFQEPRLFPHLRVAANLRYGMAPDVDLADRIAELDFLGIGHLLDRWPRTLSGGEAKRVAIGRALLSDPQFLLLDEPLSSLDPARREEIMQVIERLRDVVRLPILMVTHDREEAERLGSRIIAMA
ncbi:ATP-binding cassette domain-containing protein [Sphingosinithalassobacter portus]|uniref:ATP-binding cassette domain-containing protein n=1 Tax=Stakelama portus TaxID=2676234 RepID=UPI000D6EA852|nr:ATP-binding cassette domain-containing protein [Sphingosinithalassobacter portus]